jgi:hypothetical protein
MAILVALTGVLALAPAASAAITPTMSVTTATPAIAGSTSSLGLDLKFAPSGNDSPDAVTINLPPGVLADAALDGGACLTSTDITDPTCQIGSGTVSAVALGLVPITTPVNFYLVPPPAAGDLAGLAVADTTGDQIGATDGIVIRPSGDPDGVGVTLDLTLPNSLGVPISITEINSTFTGIRFPATCPATPANITMSANSYDAASTTQSATAPLPVAGCASLPYSPQYSLSAARDANDKVVKLSTTITQAATESPDASVALAFPLSSLSPSIAALQLLCSAAPASGTCTPVGTVSAASPEYPTPLTGQAYLTGSLTGLQLTLVFPAPFPLTLVGSVDLKDNITTFTGLPDIPLTSLTVTLDSGPKGLFSTNCQVPSNISTATLTDQNGDKTAMPFSRFAITGCPASSAGSGSGGSSSGPTATPHVSASRLSGLKSGKASLRFTLRAAKASSLRSFTVKLPTGMSFRTHRVDQRLRVTGLSLTGAKLGSQTAGAHSVRIALTHAVHHVTVAIGHSGLKESAALRAKATATGKAALRRLTLTVIATNAKGKPTKIHVTITHFGR